MFLPALLTLALSQAPAEPPASVFGRRYDGFRQLLAQADLTLGTLDEFAEVNVESCQNWIVIVLGDTTALPIEGLNLRNFVQFGGTLLAATDRATNQFSGPFGVDFHGGPVVARDPENYYLFPTCPIVTGLTRSHPLFQGVEELVLNNSGYLYPLRGWLAVLPDGVTVGGRTPRSNVVVAAQQIGAGRALFVADHSVFVNEMLLDARQPGRSLNLPFVANTVKWLVNERDPKKLKVLFLEEGQPLAEWWDPRYERGDWPSNRFEEIAQLIKGLMDAADRSIVRLERQRNPETGLGVFDHALRTAESTLPTTLLNRLALLLPTAIVLFILMRGLWRSRRGETAVPTAPQAAAAQHDALGLRRQRIIDGNQFLAVARQLAHGLFVDLGAEPAPGKPPPDWSADGSWWERWGQRRRLRRLWGLATDRPSKAMSLRRFNAVRLELADLRARRRQTV